MWTLLAIAVFGILGCWSRFFLTGVLQSMLGRGFPYATMTINIVGSFLMGFLSVYLLHGVTMAPALRIGILGGFLGGFTTFSTFSMEALLLAEGDERWKSALYVGLSISLGIAAAFAGTVLAGLV